MIKYNYESYGTYGEYNLRPNIIDSKIIELYFRHQPLSVSWNKSGMLEEKPSIQIKTKKKKFFGKRKRFIKYR